MGLAKLKVLLHHAKVWSLRVKQVDNQALTLQIVYISTEDLTLN